MMEHGKEIEKGRRLWNFYLFVILNGVPLLSSVSSAAVSLVQSISPGISSGCNVLYLSTCTSRRFSYCASTINALIFVVLWLLTSSKTSSTGGSLRGGTGSLWLVALTLSWGSTAAVLYFYSEPVWSVLSNLLYLGGAFCLCCQTISVIELAHQVHRYVLTVTSTAPQEISPSSMGNSLSYLYALHIISSFLFICVAIAAAYFLVLASGSTCSVSILFELCAFWSGLIFCALSLTAVVNKGLLVPSTVWLHTSLLCWYLKLSLSDQACNAPANTNLNAEKCAASVVFTLLFLFTVYFGLIRLQINACIQQFCEAFGISICMTSFAAADCLLDEELGIAQGVGSLCSASAFGGASGDRVSFGGGSGAQSSADMPPVGETSSLLGNKTVSIVDSVSSSDYQVRRSGADKYMDLLFFAGNMLLRS